MSVAASGGGSASARRGNGARRERVSISKPVIGVVIVALAFSAMILGMLDLRDNDGAAPLFAMFVIPALATAAIIQIAVNHSTATTVPHRSYLWWASGVPIGSLAGFLLAFLRDPDYFIGDAGWGAVILVPIAIAIGPLVGALVWFFAVFPVASLVVLVPRIVRREASISAILMPVTILALGVLSVIGGLSIDTDLIGRLAWPAVIAAFLGIPGSYEVTWAPGLWIVRAIVAVVVLTWTIPLLRRRRRSPQGVSP